MELLLRAGGSLGTLVAAMVRYGTLIMFFFDDVLPFTLRALHLQHHLAFERLDIYHKAAAAIAAEAFLCVVLLAHT